MIITSANTLWIVRLIVNLMFVRQRRFPGAKIAPDKICTNLWLDIRNLKIPVESLYHAHEVLQAKCIFDRGGIQYQFLKQNSWVREYLPNAYHRMNYELRSMKYAKKSIIRNSNFVIRILNGFMFGLQYLYMKPKMTTERIGLGYAFFHPGKVDNKSKLSIM